MSMLTPPGMGGQYRIKGDRYPRMRRPRNRRRIVFASVGTAAAVGLIGWGSLELIDVFSGGGTSASASAGHAGTHDCTADAKPDEARPHAAGGKEGRSGKSGKSRRKGEQDGKAADDAPRGGTSTQDALGSKLPKPGSIKVNVLNATSHSGLAKTTSEALKKRGFTIGKVANAPAKLDKKVKTKGVLMGATGTRTTARLKVLATQLKGADIRYDEREGDDVDLVLGDKFKDLTKKKTAAAALTALASPPPPQGRSGHCPG
jgi:hypothetical protein